MQVTLTSSPPNSASPCSLLKISPSGAIVAVKETQGTGDVYLAKSKGETATLEMGEKILLEVSIKEWD